MQLKEKIRLTKKATPYTGMQGFRMWLVKCSESRNFHYMFQIYVICFIIYLLYIYIYIIYKYIYIYMLYFILILLYISFSHYLILNLILKFL